MIYRKDVLLIELTYHSNLHNLLANSYWPWQYVLAFLKPLLDGPPESTSSFICTPSALIICLHFLVDLLIVSLVILQMLFNYVTISVVNFILCRNGIVQIYWVLYFQIYKFRIISCLNASFFQIFLTSFHRNNAFWTYHVVLHLKHTAFS